jgi:polyferredoxin
VNRETTLPASRLAAAPRAAGDWLQRNQGTIRTVQWLVVGIYLLLVAVPAFMSLPPRTAHLWNNLTLLAQFLFWGIWWPFVLLSMVLVGRAWCGLFCPEGSLTEFASRHGRGRAVPRWITWGGWPFVAFACTTIYGQMVSVYQYPKPVLLILGGSTVAAIVIGLNYGRRLRVWCRYLCPVNGVFGLLSKLAPLHFRVDADSWRNSVRHGEHPRHLTCAPLVPVRSMQSSSPCHMCGRCSGFRDAVQLSARSPNHEIVHVAGGQPKPWDTVLIFFGLMGIALGAFKWTGSDLFIDAKQTLATWLVGHNVLWPLEWASPWWLLTHYPAQNDVMSLLDGTVLLGYIGVTALLMGLSLSALTALAARVLGPWSWRRFHHLAQTFIPLGGCGVFLGLSALTVTMLHAEHITLSWVPALRAALLVGASLWTIRLSWQVAGLSARGTRRLLATAVTAVGAAVAALGWASVFWST